MRSALVGVMFLVGTLSITQVIHAGVVDVSPSVLLKADVTATLGDAANPGDSKESHDTGGLSKTDVAAQATASVPVESGAFTGSGAAEAHVTVSDDGFVLSGHSSASLAGTSSLAGEVRSVASIDFPFVISEGFGATSQFSVTIDAPVNRNEKVAVVVDRSGLAKSVFVQTFDETASTSLPPLEPGDYHLQLVSGSLASTKGITGEAGSAAFQFSLAATPESPTTIPLPMPLASGAAALVVAMIARRRMASRFC